MVDAGRKAELKVLFNNLTGDAAHVLVTNAAVVGTLWLDRVAVLGKAQRTSVLVEEVLLFETDPKIGIVLDRRAHVRRVRRAVRVHYFAKNQIAIFAGSIGVERYRFQNAV